MTFARLFALIRSNKNIFNWGISAIFLEQAAVDFIAYFIARAAEFFPVFGSTELAEACGKNLMGQERLIMTQRPCAH